MYTCKSRISSEQFISGLLFRSSSHHSVQEAGRIKHAVTVLQVSSKSSAWDLPATDELLRASWAKAGQIIDDLHMHVYQ